MDYSHSKESKTSEKVKGLQRKINSPWLSIILGLIIFAFGALNYYQVRILSFDKIPRAASQVAKNPDIPAEIIVPSLNLDLKVDPGIIKNGVWLISDKNATFLNTSAAPGVGGNTVIYGHNKKVIFGSLPRIKIGDSISIKTTKGIVYNYIVDDKLVVNPDRVDLVSPTSKETLTVYTCYGPFDSKRLVIVAKPKI